jgi:putative holliday junction resolvase
VRCTPAYNRVVNRTEKRKRVLALDVGTKRIGMAVTDELGITAQGLATLERQNKKSDLARLVHVLQEYDVGEVVVGMPLRMSGDEGTQAEKMRAFAHDLKEQSGLPLHFWDERLTSAEANRMLDEAGMTRLDRKGKVDQMAAVMILQSWMERNSR